jgi:predicted PurR-regulated permease PerM
MTGGERASRPPAREDDLARSEHRALNWAAAAAVAAIAWIALPVSVGILLGALIAFIVQPLYERLAPRLGPAAASLTCVLGSAFWLVACVGGLGWLFVASGSGLARELIDALGPGGGANRAIAAAGHITSRFGVSPEEAAARLRGLAEGAAARAASLAGGLIAATTSALLALFFAMLTMHFILGHWQRAAARAQEALPLRPDYTRELVEEFRRAGRTTLLGTVVTGLAQGALATIGYAIAGMPKPLFFGVATAVASLIPAVGTLLVWVPAGVVLILTGHPFDGVVELVWGTLFIVGLSDYVIRPRLVGSEAELPSLVTFTALFGGVEVFGLKGLIVGPVIMSLAIAVLRLYVREAAARRETSALDAPRS